MFGPFQEKRYKCPYHSGQKSDPKAPIPVRASIPPEIVRSRQPLNQNVSHEILHEQPPWHQLACAGSIVRKIYPGINVLHFFPLFSFVYSDCRLRASERTGSWQENETRFLWSGRNAPAVGLQQLTKYRNQDVRRNPGSAMNREMPACAEDLFLTGSLVYTRDIHQT